MFAQDVRQMTEGIIEVEIPGMFLVVPELSVQKF